MFTQFALEDLYNSLEGKYLASISSAAMPALSLAQLSSIINHDFFDILSKDSLDYGTKFGDEELRVNISSQLYKSIKADQILLTAGAAEAINIVMSTLFEAGDIVIAQKPMYQSLYQILADRGIEVIDWDLSLGNFSWDINELEELLRKYPQLKALVINNPNNPVGKSFSSDELNQISKILEDRLLISDEVFLPIDLRDDLASVVDIHENSIAICDLSKSFALPGLRLGWIVSKNHKLLESFLAYKNYLSLRVASLSEIIAREALRASNALLDYNKKILRNNIELLYKREDLIFDWIYKPTNVCALVKPNIDLDQLLQTKSIFALDTSVYGTKYKGFMRLGLGNIDIKNAKIKENAANEKITT
jgi:aspartate/methionine/tyrosine aminotransferase